MKHLNKSIKFLLLSAVFLFSGIQVMAQDYTDGVFILNEDWFGHNNSTINFWHVHGDNSIDYRIIQQTNQPLSLGCTSQFGTIYGDKLFVVSKQDQDPGDNSINEGGRFVVADIASMEILAHIQNIAENDNGISIADGRAFVGVDENKGYIGTSNGIYVFDFNYMEITDVIAGSENPLISGGEYNGDGLGPLYRNQIGVMVRALDYVFAIQQDRGILVINPETDEIETVIEGCFSTMVLAKDGNIYAGRNSNMDYQEYPYGNFGANGEEWRGDELLRLNPETLKTDIITLDDAGINQSWYAWTAGSLVASTSENALYFIYINPDSSVEWFTAHKVYKYDIDSDQVMEMYDTELNGRYIYTGGGLSISPLDNTIYINTYLNVVDQNYWFERYDSDFNLINEKQPSQNYWFPAMIIHPDVYEPVVEDFEPVTLGGEPFNIDLSTMATDADNMDAGITKKIISGGDASLLTAKIKANTLTLTPQQEVSGATNITVRFNSNGKTVDKTLAVNVNSTSTVDRFLEEVYPTVFTRNGAIVIENVKENTNVQIFNTTGQLLLHKIVSENTIIHDLPKAQFYIVKTNTKNHKIIF